MCKHWRSSSNIFWIHEKSFSTDARTWGFKKTRISNLEIRFESLLEKCGRFLTHFVFYDYEVNEHSIYLVTSECPNLQVIDIMKHQLLLNAEDLQIVKLIFDKVRIFHCFIENVKDQDLKDLFSKNHKLEYLKIYLAGRINPNCLFLNALPCETMRVLIIDSQDVPFHRICEVSHVFQFLTFFINNYRRAYHSNYLIVLYCTLIDFFCNPLIIFLYIFDILLE